MQRLRSLRRSVSRSSRRKSGGSTTSAGSSPRRSQDTGISDASSTPDLTAHAVERQEDGDPPPLGPPTGGQAARDAALGASPPLDQADAVGDTSGAERPDASLASLDTATSDPPVLVEPPSPDIDAAVPTATGREPLVDSSLRRRHAAVPDHDGAASAAASLDAGAEEQAQEEKPPTLTAAMPVQRSWLLLAVASGGFAALNGVFAKLTTADITTHIASFLSTHLQIPEEFLNPTFRGLFFFMNIISNAIMWGLFTRALTAHPSATKVSLINTSANFLVTAVLGTLIFAELLPAGWFGGAALLVLGTLIIGRDRQGQGEPAVPDTDEEIGTGTLSFEKEFDAVHVTEMTNLLAGDETEGVRADGEEEDE